MSVVIKYMDLPKSCSDCQFCVQKYATDEYDAYGDMCLAMVRTWDDDRLVNYYEDENGEYHDFDIESGRHPDCPMRQKMKPLTPGELADALMNERIRGELYSDITFKKEVIRDVKCELTVCIRDRRPCYCGAELREVWREESEE